MSTKVISLQQFIDDGELQDAETGQNEQPDKTQTISGKPDFSEQEPRSAADQLEPLSEEEQVTWSEQMEKLHKWNYWMMILHGGQSALQIILTYQSSKAKNFVMPVTSLFQTWDGGYPVQVLALYFNYNLLRVLAFQSLISCLGHAAVLQWWDVYERDLRRGQNRFRWWEYSLSASILITVLFHLWGNLDWVQLSGCFLSSFATQLYGSLHEQLNAGARKDEINWISIKYGMFTGLIPWAIMFYEMANIPEDNDVPWWVWLAVGEYMVLFASFPLTLIMQYMQVGKFNNKLYPLLSNGGYIQGELQYQFLSLFTKSLLTWQVAGAITGPDAGIWNSIEDSFR